MAITNQQILDEVMRLHERIDKIESVFTVLDEVANKFGPMLGSLAPMLGGFFNAADVDMTKFDDLAIKVVGQPAINANSTDNSD